MSISLMLVDDHPLLRQGVRALLENEPDFKIVGEASSGLETLKKAAVLRPNIVILDLGIPELNGLEVIRQLQKETPQTRVIVLSMHDREAYVCEAFKNGALAYVLKGAENWELIRAIREAAQGRRYLSTHFHEIDLETSLQEILPPRSDPLELLTQRERQIMHLAAEGWSNQQIAAKLTISQRTVEVHRLRMMHKLKLNNQAELVRFVISRGAFPGEAEWSLS